MYIRLLYNGIETRNNRNILECKYIWHCIVCWKKYEIIETYWDVNVSGTQERV